MSKLSKIEDFLLDDDFIRYVYENTPGLSSLWKMYFVQHPEEVADANTAKSILLGETIDYVVHPDQHISWKAKLFNIL